VNTKLKPCPWGTPALPFVDKATGEWWIQSESIPDFGPYDTLEEATEVWNTRPIEDALADALKEARKSVAYELEILDVDNLTTQAKERELKKRLLIIDTALRKTLDA